MTKQFTSFPFPSTPLLLSGLALILAACESSPTIYVEGDGVEDPTQNDNVKDTVKPTNNIDLGNPSKDETPVKKDPPADLSVCGDGLRGDTEVCDDGNTVDDDGCSANCQVQSPTYTCKKPGELCVNTVVCGNGVLEGDEACDDTNVASGDGCKEDCSAIEEGFICARPGRPCVAQSVCGNGDRERGEQCDDGQSPPQDGDGCSEACQEEDGYFCALPGEACVVLSCGDGNRTPDEQCDDGQSPPLDGDGCSALCTLEPGYSCNASGCREICGDGLKVGSENNANRCDDGNRSGGDGCSPSCTVEPFFACNNATPNECLTTIACDNGLLEPGEVCDAVGVDGCLPGCKTFSSTIGGGSTCDGAAIEAGEQCDGGAGCTNGCELISGWSCPQPGVCFEIPRCGDGIFHSPLMEECDDGNNVDSDGCTNQCKIETGYACSGLGPSQCVQELCGDSVRTVSEECEDSNGVANDGCTNCKIDIGYICPRECPVAC